MRRYLTITAVIACLFAATACDPPSVTAVPSTIKPACREVTTVTGVGTPASEIRNVALEIQISGQWKPLNWFPDLTSTRKELKVGVKPDGSYSITYAPPMPALGAGSTARLRIRGYKMATDKGGAISKSWYVTVPIGC